LTWINFRDCAEADKRAQKQIDPERLCKAIRYLKEHSEQQAHQF
jgi:hypothetical protein